jgi:membrane fusion protein (multidrug efflux system)
MTPESSAPPTPVAAPAPAAIPPAPPSPPPAAHRSLLAWALWCVAGVIAIVVAYFGYHWFTYRLSHSITDDAFVEAHIVNVAPEMVSGRIVRFLVEENDQVKEGQVLAEIDPVHYRDQLDQARGKLDLAEAELKRQEAGLTKLQKEVPLQIDVAEKAVDEAEAAVAVAKANLILAKQEFDRFTELAKQDASTIRKADEVTRTHDAAKAEARLADTRLDKARKMLDLARTGYDQIHEVKLMVGVKKEVVKDAQIALDTAKHVLEFTQVLAPFPGVVVKRYRNLGDFVSAGTPILSMYNPELIYVTANLEETRLRGVAPGNPVELHVDAFDHPFQGRVVWINKSTGAQFALMPRNVVAGEFTKVVQRVPVRIWIEKDERWRLLRAGLSVQAIISHGEGDPQWGEQAAREMRDLEARYNQPRRPDRRGEQRDQR